MTVKRMKPDDRRASIITAGLSVAVQRGYTNLTRQEVAAKAGVTEALITHYFGTLTQLRRAVMRAAIAQQKLHVILEGLVCGDPTAAKAPESVKDLARATVGEVGR